MGRTTSSSSSSGSSSNSSSSSSSEEMIQIKPKKKGIREIKKRQKAEMDMLTKEIYLMFTTRQLTKENVNDPEKKALKLWENADTSKRKEEWHPYLLYCKENRESVVAMGISGSDVMKKLSSMWKELSADKRNGYKERARLNKEGDMASLGIDKTKKDVQKSKKVKPQTSPAKDKKKKLDKKNEKKPKKSK
ncbi:HMG box domain-containing protein [Entamoeba marina]